MGKVFHGSWICGFVALGFRVMSPMTAFILEKWWEGKKDRKFGGFFGSDIWWRYDFMI